MSDSRPLCAGRRLPRNQEPGRLIPVEVLASGFDDTKFLNDASSMGSLSFVFRTCTCSRFRLKLFLQRSPPRLLTAAAWSGLRSAPESRSRGALPHLSRSFTTLLAISFLLSLQHTEPEEVFLVGLVQYGSGCSLDDLVLKRRHGERSLPSVGLRYIPTPGWLRPVRSPMDPGMY
jgi:hypothetical protein